MHLVGCLTLLSLLAITNADVKFIIAIWRHGDRAPDSKPYPNDVYNISAWPRGWNQLTNIGIQQTYELGQWFKEKYIEQEKLLPSNFDYKKVFYRSSDSERAIQSAHSHAAGMFPAKDSSMWTSTTNLAAWQPIPVHTNGPENQDPLLRPTSYTCPSYSKLILSSNTPFLKTLGEEYKDLFIKLSNYTGMTVTIENVKQLFDITREMAHGLKQPDWINELWNGTKIIDNIKELKRITRTSEFNSEEKSRYRAGYLLNDWSQQLENASKNASERLATLYSSHDGTLSALTYLMGINDDNLVPYAAAVVAELHQNNTVRILYRTSNVNVTVLKIEGCDEFCPIDSFLSKMEPRRIRTVQNLDQTCSGVSGSILYPIFMISSLYKLFNFV